MSKGLADDAANKPFLVQTESEIIFLMDGFINENTVPFFKNNDKICIATLGNFGLQHYLQLFPPVAALLRRLIMVPIDLSKDSSFQKSWYQNFKFFLLGQYFLIYI